jgi:GH3 auxin-responsive promoter
MNLQEMLKQEQYDKIWEKYCGFLDLTVEEFMNIQERLLLEQIDLLSKSKIGKKIMGEVKPTSMEDFRKRVPLTSYEDYADILLKEEEDALPTKPLYWIKTTWKGGTNEEIKQAPYSTSMIEEHTKAFIAALLLATSKKRGDFSLRIMDKFLYGMAPLPYLTGLAPHALENEIKFNYLPPIKEAESLGFRERNKVGFNLALNEGADLFFGLSSVLVKIGKDFNTSSGSKKKIRPKNLKMAYRLVKAYTKKKVKKQEILPKDVFKFKGILCAGTDSIAFKDKIEYYFGKKPIEIFGGTEIATVAVETWGRTGLTFFPDVNFLEFIPEEDSLKSLSDTSYQPKTVLLNELKPGQKYELVTTKFRGGVFARYRVGDMIECLSLEDKKYGIRLPQIRYVDRISNVIDIAGFTRITETTIKQALQNGGMGEANWVVCKEYEANEPKLHIIVEGEALDFNSVKEGIHQALKKLDSDYNDIEDLLGLNILKLTVVKPGTFEQYKEELGAIDRVINPSRKTVMRLLEIGCGLK